MSTLTKKEKRLFKLVESGATDKEMLIIDEISELEEKFDATVQEIKDNAPDIEAIVSDVKTKQGDKGDKGDKGDDGYTPQKGVDYFDGKNGYTPVKGVDYFDGEDGYTPIKGKDYFDGKDGDIKDLSPDEIRNALELLQEDERLDIKSVKGFDESLNLLERRTTEQISRIPRGGGGGNMEIFSNGTRVNSGQRINFDNNIPISTDGSGATVVTATHITVSATEPANPYTNQLWVDTS